MKQKKSKKIAKKRIGIADTMFAKGDMGKLAIKTVRESKEAGDIEISRVTVPGIKDLPVAAKKLIEEKNCEIVLAFGMVGKVEIDEVCGHEASLSLMQAELLTNTHILKVFVHEREALGNAEKLVSIMRDRTIKHTKNAIEMIFSPKSLSKRAGTGQRQGSGNDVYYKL